MHLFLHTHGPIADVAWLSACMVDSLLGADVLGSGIFPVVPGGRVLEATRLYVRVAPLCVKQQQERSSAGQ